MGKAKVKYVQLQVELHGQPQGDATESWKNDACDSDVKERKHF